MREEIINNLIQSAIDGTIFFAAGWQKLMKSVEKYAYGYGLRSVCTLYQYFYQKIIVLPYNICFEFISSYILMQICTYIQKLHMYSNFDKNYDSKRGNGSFT